MNSFLLRGLGFFAGLFLFANLYAQEKSSPAEDFTLTDINGNVVNLYETIADGKTVILYFFSCSCVHCYMEAPIVDSVYRQLGSGNEQLVVWGISDQLFNNEDIQFFIDSTNVTFPCFATGHATDVFSLYDILYTPQIKIVCDYMVSESIPNNQIIENLNYCFPANIRNDNNNKPLINAGNNFITIETDKSVNSVSIFDLTGKKLISAESDNLKEIGIPGLIPGNLYIINIIFADGTSYSGKIIIK